MGYSIRVFLRKAILSSVICPVGEHSMGGNEMEKNSTKRRAFCLYSFIFLLKWLLLYVLLKVGEKNVTN